MPRLQRLLLPAPPAIADDWALFLDVDGTLLEFAQAPDAVDVPAGLVDALGALNRRLDGAMALVSGRSLATLAALMPALADTAAAGLHGLEWRRAGADAQVAPHAPATLSGVHADAQAMAAAHPGLVVEAKGPALALHWRRAPHAAPIVHDFAERALARLPGYLLQHGDHVVELRPGGDGDGDGARIDKGTAIERFMRDAPFAGRRAVFVGDDLTDEHGFAVVNALGGFGVRVGMREPTRATTTLESPHEVRRWLVDGAQVHAIDEEGKTG